MEASDTIGELIALQEIDLEILRIGSELSRLEEELSQLQESVAELEAQAGKHRADAEAAEERVRRFQRSVQAGRATLKRLETRAGAVSNMQQHFAARSETDTARRNLRMAEDDALGAMQEAETAGAKLQEVEARLDEARVHLEGRAAEVSALRETLERELRSHRQNKKTQEERLDDAALRLYASVSSGRTDAALAALTADGVC